jgi:hypothetical protein
MAAITHRGITYTTSAGTPAMVMDLPLWAGVEQDDSTWISAYPGALTDFEPRQTDGTNAHPPRFVILTWTGATAAATLTLSSDVGTDDDGTLVNSVLGVFAEATTANDSGVSGTGSLVLTHNSSATETLSLLLIIG